MQRFVVFLVVSLFISGCASEKNIVSPSLSEEETSARARAILHEKKQAAPEPQAYEQVSPPPAVASPSDETEQPTLDALINVLIRKGIITQKELNEEVIRLKKTPK